MEKWIFTCLVSECAMFSINILNLQVYSYKNRISMLYSLEHAKNFYKYNL